MLGNRGWVLALALAGLGSALSGASKSSRDFGKVMGSGKSPRQAFKPYVDRAGLPHGSPGDKLIRKAASGKIGIRHRGPYAAWHLKAK